MTATTYDGGSPAGSTGPIPDDLADAAQSAREALIDVVAENDDALIEKYLEGEEITTEELIGAILAGVKERRIFPVVCAAGSAGDRRRPRPRPHRRGPALAGRRGAAAGDRRARARPSRSGWRRTGRSSPSASRPWPTSSAAASTSCG